MMKTLLTPPSVDDLVRLLRAWRFWVSAAALGVLLGALVYFLAPPPYRAKATVNVDFNLEQAWPQETDRQQFYFLERESRKMEELAWSDEIMQQISSRFSISVTDLRSHVLQLGQPADAGWHFYADDHDPERAGEMASAWAKVFTERIQSEVQAGNINEYVKLEALQIEKLPVERGVSLAEYMLAGMLVFSALSVFAVLFVEPGRK